MPQRPSDHRQENAEAVAPATRRFRACAICRAPHWFVLLALSSAVRADDAAPPDNLAPRQWRLIWTTDPAHQATVSWNTQCAGSIHRVHYRSEDGREEGVVDCHETGRYTAGLEKIELYYHHVRLERLNAARQYRIAIESDGHRSGEFYFTTAPDDNRSIGLLFGGDSRSNQAVRRQMNQRMAALLRENSSLLALAHGGDYTGSGTVLSEWSQWMSDHEQSTGPDGRLLPIIPARGNHDKGALFNEVFGFPPGDANYYVTDLGEQLRLTTLNTETSIAGDQAKWLEAQLKAGRPTHRWLAVQYHRPAYPAVKTPSGALQFWVPLFDRYNVDLVYEADGHNIKRTVPIRDNVEDTTGVVYLGEGGLGAEQRKPKANRWFLKSPGMGASGHHVHLLIFSDEHWECRVVADNGKILDEYFRDFRSLQPSPASTPQAAAVR